MSSRLEYERGALRDLRRLDRRVSERIVSSLERLAEHSESVRHEQLKGRYAGLFKLRVGNYRALYDLEAGGDVIVVIAVKHRSEVYQRR